MIQIYLAFNEDNYIDFFKKAKKKFHRNNINFTDNLNKSNIVLYFYNIGKKNFFKDKNLYLKEKFDKSKEFNNIEYYIKLKKKIIIYNRQDGAIICSDFNNLLKKYDQEILFIIRDFILKDEKKYKTISKTHYRYLINNIIKKKDDSVIIKNEFNNLNKLFCYSFPKLQYTFLDSNSKPYKNFIFDKNYNKEIDIFYVKNYRMDLFNGIYRKTLLDKLIKIKNNNNFNIYTDNCDKTEFYNNLLKSKIMISVWGNGESLRDDYFCIHHNIIVLKVDTSHVNDFYNLHEKNNIFHFFNIDFSNLEKEINKILNNYEYYYNLYLERKKIFIEKYNLDYHVNKLSEKIKKTYS